MKTKFAAIIGMILIMTSAAMPVQAAAAVTAAGTGASKSTVLTEGVSYADKKSEFRYMSNGWHYKDGNWYYIRGGKAVTGWVKDKGKWYYMTSKGTRKTGWVKVKGFLYYLGTDGAMKTGWLKLGGKTYYMTPGGAMKTGWLKLGGKTYYMTTSGAMKTGWLKVGGKYYFMGSDGAMKTGWLKRGTKTYYMTASGAMKTGWLTLGGKLYYFDTNGVLDEEKTKAANPQKTAAASTSNTKAKDTTQQTKQETPQTETTAKTKGEMVAQYALQFVGNPYVYGGCSLTKGTDCSGFVMLIYRHFGVNLPHYDAAIRARGTSVDSLEEAKAGDIICYYGHVAIYLGDGRIVHASNSRDGIKISERADYRTIAGIRRIFE